MSQLIESGQNDENFDLGLTPEDLEKTFTAFSKGMSDSEINRYNQIYAKF